MNGPFEKRPDWKGQRDRIIGLGESSIRKSYYPELQQQHEELLRKNRELQAAYEELYEAEDKLRQNFNQLMQKERDLERSEIFLSNIFENNPDMIFVKNAADFRYVRINRAGEELTGFLRDEIIGKTACDLFPKEVADAIMARDRKVLAARHAADIVEEKIVTREKGERILQTKMIPILDDAGNPRYLMGIAEDITEFKRTEGSLNLARHKLALLNAVTFQDIQTAAFTLSAYHELMKTFVTDERGRMFLEKQESMNQKILDSLNFAKHYQDMGMQNPRWQDVREVFLYAISHLDFLHIRHTCHVDGLQVYADPLLERAIFHLMQNVTRHSGNATEVSVSYIERSEGLTLMIEDNGIGIPAGEKHMIFDRGYGKNAGLGLFLVREVLSITGIGIRETGEPGKGARFEIAVPKNAYRFVTSS